MADWRAWVRARARWIDTAGAIGIIVTSSALLAHFLLGPRNLDAAYMQSIVPPLVGAAGITLLATGISFLFGLGIGFLVGWAKTVKAAPPVVGERPFGVFVLIVLFLFQVAASANAAFQSFATAYALRTNLGFAQVLPGLWSIGMADAIFSGLYAIASMGLWRLRRWGWFLSVATTTASTITGFAILLVVGLTAFAVAGVVLLPLVLLMYLFIVAGALGIDAPLLARGANRAIRRVADGYVELMRGTPLFVQIVFMWSIFLFTIPVQNPALLAGVVAMTINTGAYQGEIFRGGLQTIHTGQVEAARAIGLTRWQTMRNIVLPQALRLIIPPLTNEFVALLKASSLMYFIGVAELTFVSKQLSFREARIFEVFVVVTGIYLLMTVPLSKVVQWVERRYRIPGLGIQAVREERTVVPAPG